MHHPYRWTRLGPYEILAPIGAGGMGEVYRARDTRLDRTVAIKILPERFKNDPELQARFQREARAISSLQHPHICSLFDVGQQDAVSFLVMEYIEGETLASRIAKGCKEHRPKLARTFLRRDVFCTRWPPASARSTEIPSTASCTQFLKRTEPVATLQPRASQELIAAIGTCLKKNPD